MYSYSGNLLPSRPFKIDKRLKRGTNSQTVNLRYQTSHDSGNVLFKKIKKLKYADNACNATFIKRPDIMRVFPNYAKDLDYASAIYKGLHKTSLSVAR